MRFNFIVSCMLAAFAASHALAGEYQQVQASAAVDVVAAGQALPAAARTKAAMQQSQAGTTYTWYDGGTAKQVLLDDALIAEFGSGTESGSRAAGAGNGVRILRKSELPAGRAQANGRFSPVLRDGAGGQMRALPGNVIVQLDPSWGAADISRWLNSKGLVEVRRLPFGNYIVVLAPAGLASLELANRLHKSGDVVSAQPDWWVPRARR